VTAVLIGSWTILPGTPPPGLSRRPLREDLVAPRCGGLGFRTLPCSTKRRPRFRLTVADWGTKPRPRVVLLSVVLGRSGLAVHLLGEVCPYTSTDFSTSLTLGRPCRRVEGARVDVSRCRRWRGSDPLRIVPGRAPVTSSPMCGAHQVPPLAIPRPRWPSLQGCHLHSPAHLEVELSPIDHGRLLRRRSRTARLVLGLLPLKGTLSLSHSASKLVDSVAPIGSGGFRYFASRSPGRAPSEVSRPLWSAPPAERVAGRRWWRARFVTKRLDETCARSSVSTPSTALALVCRRLTSIVNDPVSVRTTATLTRRCSSAAVAVIA